MEFLGEEKLEGVVIQHRETGEKQTLKVQGVFPLVGQDPNSKYIELDIKNEWGNIPVERNMETRVAGAFAGGDILPREIRQIYLAEHDGKVAANSIEEYLRR